MPYHKLLKRIISEKHYTNKKLAELTKLSASYIGKLQKIPKMKPTEKVSKAIAKACGVDARELIIEAYIDEAPDAIIEMLKAIKFMGIISTMKLMNLQNIINPKEIEKEIEEEPLSDIVISILDNKKENAKFLNDGVIYEKINDKFNFSLAMKMPQGIEIKDNAMQPIIQKGDKVTIDIKPQYKSNDILLILYDEKIIARYIYKINSTLKLVAINKKYDDIIVPDINKIKILGSINGIIRKI